MPHNLRLYSDLASWWALLSPAAEYADEAQSLLHILALTAADHPRTLLELGSGGGSLASHLKAHFMITLSDRSPEMLAVSQQLNPELEHVLGDMRDMRLGREFDVVLIHDAIMYCVTAPDLRAALAT
ncbi:MAG: class I SAM-dependent methyltransferase, partial [Gemmatimonadaceae bacterium]